MGKDKICNGCVYNNNGWCKARKTNQGLKDLVTCEYRKTDNLVRLEGFIEQKKFELGIQKTSYNRGVLDGLEIALKIMKE
jgi:hypothetical protein